MLKTQLWRHRNKLHFKIYQNINHLFSNCNDISQISINSALVNIRDFFREKKQQHLTDPKLLNSSVFMCSFNIIYVKEICIMSIVIGE